MANDLSMADRRLRVGRLRLQGLTIREIEMELPKLGILNPQTGNPYTHGTIHNDILVIRDEWRESATRERMAWKAEQLAHIREGMRACWADNDMAGVARFLKMEIDLTGTASPILLEHSGSVKTYVSVSPDDWDDDA